jgi:outer membrane protein assembly factor BamB
MNPAYASKFWILVVLVQLARATAFADNWPQWRGGNHNGISEERNIPTKWNRQEGVLWRLPLPGPAGSTPAIWDQRIFVTSVDRSGQLLLLCIGTDGKEQWRRLVATGNHNVRGDEGNYASNSPSTDGKFVWVMMGNGIIACHTIDGNEVWKFDLQDRYGRFDIQFGLASTPVLESGRLFLQMIHGDGGSSTEEALLVCLDAATGKEIWQHRRITGATQENEHSYSSPTIYNDGQRKFLVSHGGDYITAHKLEDGSELWRYCLNPKGAQYHPTLRFVASPLAAPGFVIAPSAKNGPIVCIKADAKGDVTDNKSAILWRREKGTPDVPSPLYHDGLVYLCRENGNLVCVDALDGKTIYEERTTADRHRASPVLADGKIYTSARNGIITVAKVGRTFEILAQNDMGEPISSSPAISQGRIYLRTFDALYAIGSR